jgi:hypothetical protein
MLGLKAVMQKIPHDRRVGRPVDAMFYICIVRCIYTGSIFFNWERLHYPYEGAEIRAHKMTIGGNPMTTIPVQPLHRLDTRAAESDIPPGLRVIGSILRIVFIASLLAITVRVSMPQSETIWTAYDTPGDLVRLALGLAVCLWIAMQLFRAPTDRHAYQTWVYFGLAAVPFTLIFLFATW